MISGYRSKGAGVMKQNLSILAILLALGAGAAAQEPASPANPLSSGAKRGYDIIKGYIIKSAEKMPEEHYAFKPTPDVRSFGELLGHIADANFAICATVAGEKPPQGGFEPATSLEKTKKTKAELSKAVADSFTYCDKVHAGMTDAKGAEMLPKTFVGPLARLAFLEFNTHHDFEHYGNLVTYMRLKGLVPPSSERTQ
jgi:uncharacterized damage-inducible protein DinB